MSLGRCLGFEIVALSDIITVDLGLCVDSILTNEMQIVVDMNIVKGGHIDEKPPTARPEGS
jgi:hypothetical protein